MRGDFSRVTFDPIYNFSRVLMQQGRVQLDADFNEQTDILLHLLRRLTVDIVGPYGIAPGQPEAFRLNMATEDNRNIVRVAGGRAYVGGLLVELPVVDDYKRWLSYAGTLENETRYLIYLETWEQHVTWHETTAPIREVALGDGVDTATRTQVVWRLGAIAEDEANCAEIYNLFPGLFPPPTEWGMMSARTDDGPADEACVVPAGSRYRGLENQLYRVEIHAGGDANTATFKWSRDNGSVVFPVDGAVGAGDTEVRLLHLGRDARFGLEVGDWVEVVGLNDATADPNDPNTLRPLLKVKSVNPLERTVELSGGVGAGLTPAQRPILRRWDQREDGDLTLATTGAAHLYRDKPDTFDWLDLEDGLQVQFTKEGTYQAGDYWLIPGRTATGGIEWPPALKADGQPTGDPAFLPARREERHRMPLGSVRFPMSEESALIDCRRFFYTV